MCTMTFGVSNRVGEGNSTLSVGYLYLVGGKILCRGLRHSICNHFNGQMPSGQEVVAGLTNSTGLVLCGGDPPSPTNLTLWCTISGYTTIPSLYRRRGAQAGD